MENLCCSLIENSLVPQCNKFCCLRPIMEQNEGFELDIAGVSMVWMNWLSGD